MDPAIVVTLVVSVCGVVFASITAPIILLRRTEAQHAADRREDWARQDEVAARAELAATALKDAQEAQAAAAEEVARKAAQAAADLAAAQKEIADKAAQAAIDLTASQKVTADALLLANSLTNGKLDVIHTLVNSNMTTAMENEMVSAERELAMMLEVVALKRRLLHEEPTVEALTAIEASKIKITELTGALHDRALASEKADRGTG